MAIFEILNVGQGDSILVRPPQECMYKEETIFVDLGPGKYNITERISENDRIHIFLTHHDKDHLGGLQFFIGKLGQVSEITVPLYQNEITLIARAILHLKGIGSSKDCNEFIKALEEIVSNQAVIKSLVEGSGSCPQLSFAYEGKHICGHIECLNPPMFIESNDWIGETETNYLVQLMHEIFTESFAREMEIYIRTYASGNTVVDSREFIDLWLPPLKQNNIELTHAKCNYVLDFIMANAELLRNFNAKSNRRNLQQIYSEYAKNTHDVCMVLKTNFNGETMLLAGDASKKVFNRLIKEGTDISASYLKMPHHGSKYNMNQKILNKINPRVAIISHDNGHFGRSEDTHPNQEVLNLLSSKNINVLITNDVVKNGVTIMDKHRYNNDAYVDIL